jgi:RimJ/RimL family protein N-acetyltransferase
LEIGITVKNCIQLFGYNCYLTEVCEDDTEFIISIRTSNDLNALSGSSIAIDQHLEWLQAYKARINDYYWVVRDKLSGDKIGTTALFDIDNNSKKAESGRTIVLEQYRHLTFDVFYARSLFAFETLGLNKVYGKVREESTDILNFDVKKLGYKVDGLLREDWWDGNRYRNFFYISMLRSEFMMYKDGIYKKYLKNLERLSQRTSVTN